MVVGASHLRHTHKPPATVTRLAALIAVQRTPDHAGSTQNIRIIRPKETW